MSESKRAALSRQVSKEARRRRHQIGFHAAATASCHCAAASDLKTRSVDRPGVGGIDVRPGGARRCYCSVVALFSAGVLETIRQTPTTTTKVAMRVRLVIGSLESQKPKPRRMYRVV